MVTSCVSSIGSGLRKTMQVKVPILPFRIKTSEKLGRVVSSALDPIISSGTTFLVQAAVLLTASKLEFAAFSLSYSYVLMGQSVLSAVFGGPLVTLLSRVDSLEERRRLGDAALRYQLIASLVIAAVGLSFAWFVGIRWITVLFGVLSLLGLSFRDALRSVLAAQLRLTESLISALAFAGGAASSLTFMFLIYGKVTAQLGLGALAIGAVLAVLPKLIHSLIAREKVPRVALRNIGAMAVWSLPGATVIWLQNSFYLTLVAVNLDLSSVAEVSAARMVIMPVLITASGLLRLLQVQVSRQVERDGLKAALAPCFRTVCQCVIVSVGIASICFVANPFISSSWLPSGHPHILTLAGAWLIFAGANTARGVYSALFQAIGRYRDIFSFNLAVMPFVLAGITIAPMRYGLIGAVLPMAAGELLLLSLLIRRARTICRASTPT
jgi:O-antigen/teichoic acid export membrane protein